MTDHIAETDAIVAELERAGLITVTQREDGEPIYTLTPEGGQVSRQLAMTDDAGQGALMAGLLEDVETYEGARPSRDGPLSVRATGDA